MRRRKSKKIEQEHNPYEDREYLEFIHARACYEREQLCKQRKVDYIS